jgi:hypothetical protein
VSLNGKGKNDLSVVRWRITITGILSSLLILTLFAENNSNNGINNNIIFNPIFAQAQVNENSHLFGINMRGYYTNMAQDRDSKAEIPVNYYEDSFRIFSQTGINFVRYLFFWESYERDPTKFLNELETVAKTADKWGIKLIYANDKYHTSSWLDSKKGLGFPHSLFETSPDYPYGTGGAPVEKNVVAKKWWENWYNRSVKDVNGVDGWSLQAEFLKKIASTVDNHTSTLGYELLNEPHLNSPDQWDKIGKYNTFLTNELRTVTQKTIFFSRQIPSSIFGPQEITPENIAKMAPMNKKNVVLKATLYGIPLADSYAEDRLNVYAKAAQIAGVPLCICEFNIKSYEKDNMPETRLNQTLVDLFYQKFRELNSWGWAYWLWNFKSHTNTNFNLNNVSENGKIDTSLNFDYFKTAISKFNTINSTSTNSEFTRLSRNINDTIFPTINITSVNVTKPISDEILVKGQAFDIGSGVKLVEMKLDDGTYLAATPNGGDWLHWTASIPIESLAIGNHKLTVTATDHANHTKKEAVTFKIGA